MALALATQMDPAIWDRATDEDIQTALDLIQETRGED